jgi:hypothetical protein
MAGTLIVSGMAAGLQSGEKTIGPITMVGTTAIGTILDETLASGDNTFVLPVGATAVLLVLPSPNTAALKVRTNLDTGTGVTVGLLGWMAFPVAAGTTSIVVNAAALSGVLELNVI